MATMRRYPAEIELADENLIAFLFIFFWNFQYAIKKKTKTKNIWENDRFTTPDKI